VPSFGVDLAGERVVSSAHGTDASTNGGRYAHHVYR